MEDVLDLGRRKREEAGLGGRDLDLHGSSVSRPKVGEAPNAWAISSALRAGTLPRSSTSRQNRYAAATFPSGRTDTRALAPGPTKPMSPRLKPKDTSVAVTNRRGPPSVTR